MTIEIFEGCSLPTTPKCLGFYNGVLVLVSILGLEALHKLLLSTFFMEGGSIDKLQNQGLILLTKEVKQFSNYSNNWCISKIISFWCTLGPQWCNLSSAEPLGMSLWCPISLWMEELVLMTGFGKIRPRATLVKDPVHIVSLWILWTRRKY